MLHHPAVVEDGVMEGSTESQGTVDRGYCMQRCSIGVLPLSVKGRRRELESGLEGTTTSATALRSARGQERRLGTHWLLASSCILAVYC